MVHLDFSQETLQHCTTQILRKHSNWKDETYYLKSSFFPVKRITLNSHEMQLGRTQDSWYLVNIATKQYCKIPPYVGRSLNGVDQFTYWIGPYAFVNEFETSAEAQYLIKMLEHPRLSAAAQHKVDNILNTYKYWVQVDAQMIEILKRRDSAKEKNK